MNILEEIQNCPVEWKELGEVSHFYGGLTGKTKSDFENGTAKYVTYKNIFNNIQVELDILENVRVGENEKQNSIKYGDVLITGSSESKEEVGMSSVVTFVPEEPIYLNSFSFGIRFNEDVELLPEFTKYLFRSIEFRKQIEKTASGVTRYNISKVAFKKIKIPIPPLEIQEKIVQILDKFTEYVTELTSELTLRQKQYSYFRDYLLNFDEDGSEGANNKVYQVEWKTLNEFLKKGKGTKITASQMKLLHKEGAPIRIFAGGKTYADVNYGDIPDKDIHTEEAIVVKSRGIIDFEYCTEPFSFKNEFWSYSSDNENINLRYIYHYLVHNKEHFQNIANNMQMPQISSNDTEKFKIPVPSLEIQSRIVQVLDNFDMVCNDLNIGLPKEIDLRQKQYEFFREKLLTFVAEGEYTESRVEEWDNSVLIKLLQWVFGPIRVELGQIFNTKNGYTPTKTNLDNWRNGTIPWFRMEDIRENGGILSDSIQHITEGAVKGELFPENSIIIATSATIGYHALVTRKFLANQRFTCLLAKEGISGLFIPNFLYYYCFKLDEFCRQNTLQGNFATVDMTKFKKFKFIIPSIKRQREIVSILDNFNTLTNSLSEGLPKEIELRQKQYEYWREQLFHFDL